jgi:hypothetical protein
MSVIAPDCGLIDGLSLLLTGIAFHIYCTHTALETLCGGLCNRLCNGEMIKVIPSGLGERGRYAHSTLRSGLLRFPAWGFFHPYDVVAKIPAGKSRRAKASKPRDTDHIFGLAALNLVVEGYGLSVSS